MQGRENINSGKDLDAGLALSLILAAKLHRMAVMAEFC